MTAKQQSLDTIKLVGILSLTGFLVFLGAISLVNQVNFQEPTDGVTWSARNGQIVATAVDSDGPGAQAGVQEGDRLVGIGGILGSEDLAGLEPDDIADIHFGLGVNARLEYELEQAGVHTGALVTLAGRPVDSRPYFYLCLVGVAFLVAGLFALLRRQSSSNAQLFFWLALAFYTVLVISPTVEEAPFFDWTFWADEIARSVLPGLFLYFALTFPEPKPHFREHRTPWLLGSFGPGAVLLGTFVTLKYAPSLGIDVATGYRALGLASNVELVYIASALGLGLLLVAHSYKVIESPIERKRLKWLIGGTTLGVLPFIAIYVPLFVLDITRSPLIDLAVLPLLLVPLAFGYAVVAFRLWDVEVILKRALSYVVAALAVLAVYQGTAWGLGALLDDLDSQLPQTGALVATLLAAFLFAPLRDRVNEILDRLYYKERYRSRRELLDFGRELNTELDLGQVIELLVQRVKDMVAVSRVVVLLKEEEGERLRLVPPGSSMADGPPLSSQFSAFLTSALASRDFLYVDDMAGLIEEFPGDRELLDEEDLAYFLPVMVKGEVLGLLALGRTLSGDYLSSEDLRILQMLTSHAGLAIDNALLYRQAQQRATEFERLKNYNENIVESINVGVMVLDIDGRVRSWNECLEELHGVAREDAMARTLRDLFPSSFLATLEQARRRVEEAREPLASAYQVALQTRDDQDKVVNLSVAPLVGDEGRYGTVIIVDDVTEQTELESQLRQSDRLASVGLLAAGVAHEVNTPLAGISSYVQMLQRKLPDNDPRRAILEKIEKQTFRASRIVNNLLNFSRQQASDMQGVDMNDVVAETLTLAELPLKKRNVKVDTDLDDHLPAVWGDTGKLQQVLMNLMLNARDSMPDGGELRISTSSRDGEVIIEVADSGTGIPAEAIHKIYDPFFSTKGTGKGTGLGLSVTYGIVQEHRGTITVRSNEGEGTCFRVALPVAPESRARAAS